MPDNWQLAYGETAFAFGSVSSGFVFPTAPELSAAEIEHEDADVPRGDGVAFGSDFRRGSTVTFSIDVNGASPSDARARLSQLTRAWRADEVRSTPGATARLISDTGRTAFGRPRRFAPDLEELPSGMAGATADFATADDLWYGPEEFEVVPLVPALGGGLMAPLASPLATTASSDRSQGITVEGEVPTWPVFEVAGPITNPVVEIVGVLRLAFNLTLAYDETLVVDTRPWVRSITRNGSSVRGSLSRTSTRLSRAALPPGSHEVVLRGTSDGLASLAARWRPAFTTP